MAKSNPMLALDIFQFIVKYKEKHDGNSPTYTEIVGGTSIASTNTAWYYVRKLESVGLVKLIDNKICLFGGKWNYDKRRITAKDVYTGSQNGTS